MSRLKSGDFPECQWLFSPIYTTPSSGIVLADTKDAESVSADRQSPDQMASRCRVRLATGVPDLMHSNSRHTIFHDTYKIYGVSLFCLLFSQGS